MRNKTLVLLIACVCGTIAAIGISQVMQANPAAGPEIAMVEIFVTTKSIDVAEEITAEKIRLEKWPADRVPEGSTNQLDELKGKFARQRFYGGEPVMPVKLMNDSSGSSQKIPKGFSVVSMKADPENAVANLVRPGDRVDVMAYFKKSDVVPETTAKTVLQGVRVFAIDGQTQRDEEEENSVTAKTISLLIKKEDAEVWTWASELGKVRLTLGNLSDYENDTEQSDPGREFLKWIADHAKAQESKKLEEAATTVSTQAPTSRRAVDDFRMTKLSNGRIIEYGWKKADDNVPYVVSDSGEQQTNQATQTPDDFSAQDDFSYLNGSSSPFFQPPAGTTVVDNGDRKELVSPETK